MCGHGTIGAGRHAGVSRPIEAGRCTGSRRRSASSRRRCMTTARVTVANVPSYRHATQVARRRPGPRRRARRRRVGRQLVLPVQRPRLARSKRAASAELTAFASRVRDALRQQGVTGAARRRDRSRRALRAAGRSAQRCAQFRALPGRRLRPFALRHGHERQARVPRRRRQAGAGRSLAPGKRDRQRLHRPLSASGASASGRARECRAAADPRPRARHARCEARSSTPRTFSHGDWFESAIRKLMTTFRTLATVRHHGMELTDYEFTVPLDHDRPSGETLSIFARAVRKQRSSRRRRGPGSSSCREDPDSRDRDRSTKSGWLKRALDDYHVLLLDSRGNGRSSVVLPQTLARRGDARAQADYLMHFRADSIVRDAELIRRQLVGEERAVERARPELRRILRGALSVGASARPARSLHHRRRAAARRQRRRLLPAHLSGSRSARRASSLRATRPTATSARASSSICTGTRSRCPTGGRLTVRRFQQVGFMLGFDDGMENLHYLLEGAFCAGVDGDELSLPFLRAFETFAVVRDQSDLRGPARDVLHAGRRRRAGRRSACAASFPTRTGRPASRRRSPAR